MVKLLLGQLHDLPCMELKNDIIANTHRRSNHLTVLNLKTEAIHLQNHTTVLYLLNTFLFAVMTIN